MLAAMYREQYPAWSATQIADAILQHHLHGIDIDPRAAQLAALTLYLRAWETVRDERQARRQSGPGSYRPLGDEPGDHAQRLSARRARPPPARATPTTRMFRPVLEGIFATLEQAPILGSLLHPGAELDRALADFQKPRTLPTGLRPGRDGPAPQPLRPGAHRPGRAAPACSSTASRPASPPRRATPTWRRRSFGRETRRACACCSCSTGATPSW